MPHSVGRPHERRSPFPEPKQTKTRDCPPISLLCPKFSKTILRGCPPISLQQAYGTHQRHERNRHEGGWQKVGHLEVGKVKQVGGHGKQQQ